MQESGIEPPLIHLKKGEFLTLDNLTKKILENCYSIFKNLTFIFSIHIFF